MARAGALCLALTFACAMALWEVKVPVTAPRPVAEQREPTPLLNPLIVEADCPSVCEAQAAERADAATPTGATRTL